MAQPLQPHSTGGGIWSSVYQTIGDGHGLGLAPLLHEAVVTGAKDLLGVPYGPIRAAQHTEQRQAHQEQALFLGHPCHMPVSLGSQGQSCNIRCLARHAHPLTRASPWAQSTFSTPSALCPTFIEFQSKIIYHAHTSQRMSNS